jgi:hypothetical protein
MNTPKAPSQAPLTEAQKAKLLREKRLAEALRANLRRRKAPASNSDCPPAPADLSPDKLENAKENN